MSVMELLAQRVSAATGVLVVTHDHRLERFAHRIVYMEDGRIMSETTRAADREGISTNAWLVRAIARATESRPVHVSGKRLSGYAQS